MTWPTQEQFDKASAHGTEYALQEITNGRTEPRESPLSGEWADDLTDRDVALNVGYAPKTNATIEEMDEYAEARSELADAWERGYNDVYRSIEYAAQVAATYTGNLT